MMNHLIFGQPQSSYEVAILIKSSNFKQAHLETNYVRPLEAYGIDRETLFALDLDYPNKKVTATQAKAYLSKALPLLQMKGVNLLYVADALYFKVLTGNTKAEQFLGYVLPCKFPGYESMNVVLGVNYGSLTYNPNQVDKLDMSINALASKILGTYKPIGVGLIQSAYYPKPHEVSTALTNLQGHAALTIDIETFGLTLDSAGIGTIAFAWDEHNGVAFKCDLAVGHEHPQLLNHFEYNGSVREQLRWFFERYKGKKIFHNASFDVIHLIWNLWMKHPTDYKGLLYGLDIMCNNLEDTKLIAYLATNSTTGNELGLKVLAHEFAGNYAKDDIKDIRKIDADELLEYNLVDCLSTWYVYKKYYSKMVADQQEPLYKGLFLDSLKIIIQMQLVGMPMDDGMINYQNDKLTKERDTHKANILAHPTVAVALKAIKLQKLLGINAKRVNPVGLEYLDKEEFNPNSSAQLQALLYDVLKLPVIDYTDTRQPAVGADTLKKLKNHTQDESVKHLIDELRAFFKVDKVLGTFIKAFKLGILKGDRRWLHGNFVLGGTLSGRLSSNSPNMQNMPAKGALGKAVKSIFTPPPGYLFGFADFNALEDRTNTLLTRDPNKVKIYTEGYDGHCYRAYYYWGDEMPLIKDGSVDSVNSIKKLYPDHRDNSKAPSFALQYAGTYSTLMTNCGFSEQEAKKIEKNYHVMYEVSDKWIADKLTLCSKQGYIDVAFGLRIRTPILAKTFLGSKVTPREAEAEARSVGNAISGQSYGLLNNRAAVEFMQRVWASEYRYDILLVSLIHDAIYLIFKDDIKIVKWVNDNLCECMAWQELEEIKHDEIKMSAELDVCYYSWDKPITLKNNMSEADIIETLQAGAYEYDHPEEADK